MLVDGGHTGRTHRADTQVRPYGVMRNTPGSN